MEVCLELLLIAIITVNLVDLSGFVDTVKHWIWRWLHGNKPYVDFDFRPWSCSYCMTHWLGLLYLIIAGKWTIALYAYLLVISYMTPIIKAFIELVSDFLSSIIDGIYTMFHL